MNSTTLDTSPSCLAFHVSRLRPRAWQADLIRCRYQRTSLTQRMGWETRHVWHQTDWDAVAANPDILKFPQPEWLLGHDAGQYAKDSYEAVVSHIKDGTEFRPANLPDGYIHEDWTIETMLSREGRTAEKGFYKSRE